MSAQEQLGFRPLKAGLVLNETVFMAIKNLVGVVFPSPINGVSFKHQRSRL